jgi:FdhD protein
MPQNEASFADEASFQSEVTLAAAARVLDYRQLGASVTRELAVETAVNVVYAPIPFAVMMASPADLTDFAYGFSLTEGIINAASDILSVEVAAEELGLRLNISLRAETMKAHLSRKRALSGRTGCGLCGIEDLNALPHVAMPQQGEFHLDPQAVERALASLEGQQPLNTRTKAVHAAAFFGADGTMIAAREDVGRHNALDKLIGALLRAGLTAGSGFMVITSRCSFEMVEKAAIFGARALVSVSAPTSLALQRAKAHNMVLICVARADSALVFHGQESLQEAEK